MIKKVIQPREQWQEIVESQGFSFHTIDGQTYWDESTCYEFTDKEISILEKATQELHALCLNAVEVIIQRGYLRSVAHPVLVYSRD